MITNMVIVWLRALDPGARREGVGTANKTSFLLDLLAKLVHGAHTHLRFVQYVLSFFFFLFLSLLSFSFGIQACLVGWKAELDDWGKGKKGVCVNYNNDERRGRGRGSKKRVMMF